MVQNGIPPPPLNIHIHHVGSCRKCMDVILRRATRDVMEETDTETVGQFMLSFSRHVSPFSILLLYHPPFLRLISAW